MTHLLRKLASLAGLTIALAACQTHLQASSGQAHLSPYASRVTPAQDATFDPALRWPGDRGPSLTFPARIGLARIENGVMSEVSQAEAEAWLEMAKELGPGWGEFVPISPALVALESPGSPALQACPQPKHWSGWQCKASVIDDTVRDIRRGARRQQVDAVLIYEAFAQSEQTPNPLALTKLALVGYLVAPSENIAADGHAQAVLVDVRNGYAYGFASAVAKDAAFTLSTSLDSANATLSVQDEAKTVAAVELTSKVGLMLRDLRFQLAEMRAAKLEVGAAGL